jgi:hypothetical protein
VQLCPGLFSDPVWSIDLSVTTAGIRANFVITHPG